MPVAVEQLSSLDDPQRRLVEDLVARATLVDHVGPLSEQSMLQLSGAHPHVRHLLAHEGGDLVGYAQVWAGADQGADAELVVGPDARGRGVGRLLATALIGGTQSGRLRIWAHGDHPAAARLADGLGLVRVRTLWQLRRSLAEELPPPRLPDGVTVRTFVSGADDRAWVGLNARAFAHHPEQGRWTEADLHERMAEDWFDAAGFFLAERNDPTRLVGFHWTKVHPGTAGAAAMGEVYVVGVDPAEQGNGLGRALTLVGLHHLRDLGLSEVLLYADDDNTSAMHLYAGLGFTRRQADVMYGT